MGWRAFAGLSLLILALMVVGTPAILQMTAQSTDDTAVGVSHALGSNAIPPADQDQRDLQAWRKTYDKNKNASNALVIGGKIPTTAKDGTVTYTQIYGDTQPDGTITAPANAGAAPGRLALDGGAAITVGPDSCQNFNPAAVDVGAVTCSTGTSTTATGTSGSTTGSTGTSASTTGSSSGTTSTTTGP